MIQDVQMKQEKVGNETRNSCSYVKEDATIDLLMKRIWLDHFENAPCIPGTRLIQEVEPLSKETLEEVKQVLCKKTDAELRHTIDSLNSLSGLTIIGAKNPEAFAYSGSTTKRRRN